MIYLLLDTNIIIDIVVDRRNNFKIRAIDKLIKLLDQDEIKLIVPNIVKVETFRNIDEQVDKVGTNIKHAKQAIDSLYGISTYKIQGFDLSECKNTAKKPLSVAYTTYETNKATYKTDINNAIDLLFNHASSTVINDDELMPLVLKRKIYKRAPFHHESKESYGDGTIIETLLNIRKHLKIDKDDIIYFVTGNYKDFSDSKDNKTKFHEDIEHDLCAKHLIHHVILVDSISKLISIHLKDKISNIEVLEELSKELEYEQEAEIEEYNNYLIDEDRESVGLTPLGVFVDKLEEDFAESSFSKNVLEQFETINNLYDNIEDIYYFYYDELPSIIDDYSCDDVLSFFKYFCSNIESNKIQDIKKLFEWIETKQNELDFDFYEIKLPDCIQFDESYSLIDKDNHKYTLSIGDTDHLVPEEQESQEIEIIITSEQDNQIVAKGYIEIYYGFVKITDDNTVGDGAKEEIKYNFSEIEKFIANLIDNWNSYVDAENEIMEEIKVKISEVDVKKEKSNNFINFIKKIFDKN